MCRYIWFRFSGLYIQSAAPKDDIEIISVQDTSIIVNKSKTVNATSTLAASEDAGTVLISSVKYSADYIVTIKVGNTESTVAEHTRNTDTFSSSALQILC